METGKLISGPARETRDPIRDDEYYSDFVRVFGEWRRFLGIIVMETLFISIETKIRKVETITFQDPDKEFNLRRKRAPSVAMETKSHAATAVELDAKKTRYEIMKFATNSMETGEKLQAEERIVVELGGRRGKNANINYKLLLVIL